MKNTWTMQALLEVLVLAAVVAASFPVPARADQRPGGADGTNAPGNAPSPELVQSDWSGPRMGLMCAHGDPSISRRLKEHGLGNVVSQFGWQVEHRIAPFGDGPQLVTEGVVLMGGVEYGKLVPGATLVLGLRTRSGFEFGMGPGLSATSATSASSSLIIAAGKSIDYGAVCIPINVAVSTNPKGTMVTLIAGYAIHSTAR